MRAGHLINIGQFAITPAPLQSVMGVEAECWETRPGACCGLDVVAVIYPRRGVCACVGWRTPKEVHHTQGMPSG